MKRRPTLWVVAILCGALTTLAVLAAPSWWDDRRVVLPGSVTNDFSVINLGQLKNMASNGYAKLQVSLSGVGGAGSTVSNLVKSFSNDNNYAVANLGQLKAVAKPFYDRLIAVGLATNYPWTLTTNDDSDYSAVNIGQLKNVFNFDPWLDTDSDSMSDEWENLYFLNPNDPSDADLDSDEDGWTNLEEYTASTEPNEPLSHPGNCWYVATNGVDAVGGGSYTNPLGTLTNAFAQAQDGHRVILLPGVYTSAGNRNVNFNGKSLYVSGLPGHRDETIIDCEGAARAFQTDSGETVTLQYLTICNGSNEWGGAIVADGHFLTLHSCNFVSNSASFGGAICSWISVDIEDCVFEGNSATNQGGAIYCVDDLSCAESRFVGNTSESEGGAVSTTAGEAFMTGCEFEDNQAATTGGAVYSQVDLLLSNCLFVANASTGFAGAVYMESGVLTAESCDFIGNAASSDGGAVRGSGVVATGCNFASNLATSGGALYLDQNSSTTTMISQCRFQDNLANSGGGAIFANSPCFAENSLFKSNCAIIGGALYTVSRCMLQNCTILDNKAYDSGSEGAIISQYGSSPVSLANTIIWGNTLPVIYFDDREAFPLAYTNCCLQDGMDLPVRDASFYRNPLFDIDGWHLSSNSPCINAGRNLAGMNTQTDLDGQARIWGGTVDVGADEQGAPEVDADGDGMSDWLEIHYGLDPADPSDAGGDVDGDGLTNLQEFQYGTSPQNSDSDGDGLEDGVEVSMGLDPADSDTDGDGLPDGWEVANGLDPLLSDSNENGTIDGLLDPDHDGISNFMELLLGYSPYVYNNLPAAGTWGTGETSLSIYDPRPPCY